MFNPTPADVRRFFCSALAKSNAGQPMEAIELLASQWIARHPEHQADLADAESAVQRSYPSESANPFLHLSLHLALSEQCSIDQPRGIRQAVELLARRRGSLHDAHHEVMECLGQMLAQAQSSGRPIDGAAYIDCVQRRATRDK